MAAGHSRSRAESRRVTPEQREARQQRRAEDRAAALAADPEGVARELCLTLLARQAKTRSQLETALARREVPVEVSARVLDRLTEVGLIDDAAYAASWVQTRHQGQGLARRALSQGLRQRGVDSEVAAEALGQVGDDAERARAIDLVRRRRPALARFPADVQLRRLVGLLARKGYPPVLVYEVVRQELGGAGADGSLLDDTEVPAG